MKYFCFFLLFSLNSCQGFQEKVEKSSQSSDDKKRVLKEEVYLENPTPPDTLDLILFDSLKSQSIFKIIHLYYLNEDREKIILINNEKVLKNIQIPTDEEFKNFQIENINKIQKGFIINTFWGGGKNWYKTNFYFSYQKNSFSLYKILKDDFTLGESQSEKSEIILENLIPFEDFDIISYIMR